MEDAAVVRPENGPPFVLTVDFITPIVDEPESFGAIAAANAISDVYAMGGLPQVALAICGFPEEKLDNEILERILRGGRDKAAEAGCAIVGGHTVIDPELKYGLCVVGSLDPEHTLKQQNARPGDRLVLTKPIGTGLAAQAIKNDELPPAAIARVVQTMTLLNRGARDAALAAGAHAATDVTGFGLLGHLHNMLLACGCAAEVRPDAVPVFDFVFGLIERGLVPGGTRRNLEFVAPSVEWADDVDEARRLLLCDAQTSGGLLIAIPAEREARLCAELATHGTPVAAVVGELREGRAGSIAVR